MASPDAQARKAVEREYFARLDDDEIAHAAGKPFSDPERGRLLVEIGAALTLLPDSPGRVADLGCGTGWTTDFLARSGYDATGFDLSPDAVEIARERSSAGGAGFEVGDYEELGRGDHAGAFDGALFFDSLHHAVDAEAALATAARLLRPGGVCVVCEPGRGHAASESSLAAVSSHGVTELDMPPGLVASLAERTGFVRSEVFPHPMEVHRQLYVPRTGRSLRERALASFPGRTALALRATSFHRRRQGLVRLTR